MADNGSCKALQQSTVANVIDTEFDHCYLWGDARKPMNINQTSKDRLMTLAGVTAAERKKQPFADRDDALVRLGDKIWHAMVSTAGMSIRCE